MFPLDSQAAHGVRFILDQMRCVTNPEKGTDLTAFLLRLSGTMVEIAFLFERADEALYALKERIIDRVGAVPTTAVLPLNAVPPAHVIDHGGEQGRDAARIFFESWAADKNETTELFLHMIHHAVLNWQAHGYDPRLSLRLLFDMAERCMAYEISAQELCDVVLENKLLSAQWDVTECVAALSAIAGRRLASMNVEEMETVDHIVHVMTAEAVRLGVPAGSDWYFGLPANDMPLSAPIDLVGAIEPYVRSFFATICMFDRYEQAVACAKAAGRMIAVAAGGEMPELEAVIAKPLALSALTDTYKYVRAYGEMHATI
jgi:hypothetical protein